MLEEYMQFIIPAVIVCLGALAYYLYMNYMKKDKIKDINISLNDDNKNLRADIRDQGQPGNPNQQMRQRQPGQPGQPGQPVQPRQPGNSN